MFKALWAIVSVLMTIFIYVYIGYLAFFKADPTMHDIAFLVGWTALSVLSEYKKNNAV